MLAVSIVTKSSPGVSSSWVKKILLEAARVVGEKGKFAVTVVWTGDAEVRRLNRLHRGKDKTTDVLSFPIADQRDWPEEGERELGDIVISVSEAERQAKTEGRKYRDELALLLVHGFLHLLGHDHVKPGESSRMFRLQDETLESLGAGKEVLFMK